MSVIPHLSGRSGDRWRGAVWGGRLESYFASASGKPVVVLCAIFQHSPLVLLTLAEANIYGPLELKGKRLMRQQGVDDAAITAMFHQEGMDDGIFSLTAMDSEAKAVSPDSRRRLPIRS
ncbi:ABC transporter substrate-binding protein [Candidatus Reidiella endopervernicosa]|uniref:ABC transporter substrate-binding protein n=1 Tax=Candidatus Reidiella endopervernicosa TaxID=2738883 RepID=A0A6N0HWL6_9GAMM|nr:ABC transporter substrate-binding protein [Candidatus Reidiella endopervernicosa]QKQ26795.1 ABC transporter substrate-binding protein [Candidatus Reidiella endopervernicosa]